MTIDLEQACAVARRLQVLQPERYTPLAGGERFYPEDWNFLAAFAYALDRAPKTSEIVVVSDALYDEGVHSVWAKSYPPSVIEYLFNDLSKAIVGMDGTVLECLAPLSHQRSQSG